jgi:hypothetical protein
LLGILGVGIGVFGTLIGAAGGFLLVPLLLFLYPHESPATITSITLAVSFFNALSGTIAYARLKRVDFRSGIFFTAVGVPGALIGAGITSFLSRGLFQIIFGVVLLVVSIYLLARPVRRFRREGSVTSGGVFRKMTDAENNVYTYSYNRPLGMTIAFVVGLVSGMLGIGGGIIHVPALTQLLDFPTHIATATSHFVVATTTLSALGFHIITGAFTSGIRRAAVLSLGAIVGAQFGARLSQRVGRVLIVRLLALGLVIVALRLLIAPF